MKVVRRKPIPYAESVDDEAYTRRFVDGLVVDIRQCPEQIQAHNYWRLDPDASSTPNGVCLHHLEDEADRMLDELDLRDDVEAPEPAEAFQ